MVIFIIIIITFIIIIVIICVICYNRYVKGGKKYVQMCEVLLRVGIKNEEAEVLPVLQELPVGAWFGQGSGGDGKRGTTSANFLMAPER